MQVPGCGCGQQQPYTPQVPSIDHCAQWYSTRVTGRHKRTVLLFITQMTRMLPVCNTTRSRAGRPINPRLSLHAKLDNADGVAATGRTSAPQPKLRTKDTIECNGYTQWTGQMCSSARRHALPDARRCCTTSTHHFLHRWQLPAPSRRAAPKPSQGVHAALAPQPTTDLALTCWSTINSIQLRSCPVEPGSPSHRL